MKKRYLLCVLLVFFIGIIVNLNLEERKTLKYDFANFTTEDAMNFINEEKIQIPTDFETVDGHEEITLNIIKSAYESSEYLPHYSYTAMQEFALEIVEKVHLNME